MKSIHDELLKCYNEKQNEELIEKVAIAICVANGNDPKLSVHQGVCWQLYINDAKAAIKAVLENL